MSQICILHGWSDKGETFRKVRDFLAANGFADPIWLGDYISTQDDVRVEDVARRMQVVVRELLASGKLTAPFDLIVHSTGGLVAREWLARFYPDGAGCPLKRLVMLAPANFGSKLATMGRSFAGRIAKGWNQGFQSGTHMLEALELASPYQWDLARRDLFDASGTETGPYGVGKVWPFTIVGTAGYRSGFEQLANEKGSDGTVRACAANLQAQGLTIDMRDPTVEPVTIPWHWRSGDGFEFPCAVLADHDHGTITDPAKSPQLGELIIQALRCANIAEYRTILGQWKGISDQTVALSDPQHQQLHQYMQLVVFVHDELGNPITDYFLEFFPVQKRERPDLVAFFHQEVLEHVHVNDMSSSRRCLYIDRTDLVENFYAVRMKAAAIKELAVRIAIARTTNVVYFDETSAKNAGSIPVHNEDPQARQALDARLFHNRTHLIEVIVPRQAGNQVFGLS